MIELDELNPIAIIAGFVGALIGFYMSKNLEGIGIMWKVLTPVACFVGSFAIMHKMSDN